MATASPVRRAIEFGGDRGVVEEAVAARHRPGGMVTRGTAEPVGHPLPALDHEVGRGQCDVDGPAGRLVCPGDERIARVEAPPARPAPDGTRLPQAGQRGLAEALEHGPRRIRVRHEERPVDRLALGLRPGLLDEAHQARVMDGEDGIEPVLRGLDELELAVRREGRADALGALGDLVRRDGLAEVRLVGDVVRAVPGRVDDLHGPRILPARPASDRRRIDAD